MVTFAVDDVEPVRSQIADRALSSLWPEAIAVAERPGCRVLEPDGIHPLLGAVARAFAEHRPLVLSPDAVWLTIAQGVAQHVRLHAEELRPLLVGHTGKRRLAVEHQGPMPTDPASWAELVDRFTGALAAEGAAAGLFACDFSTSDPVDRTAGQVVLMDAYSAYYAYWVVCVCGIPSVTLTGTVDDWRDIRDRIDLLPELGLEQWCASLRPIADQLVRAARGDADRSFWQRIYNPVDAYGGEVATGWVTRLYPYLRGDVAVDQPNPMLELSIREPRNARPDSQGFCSGPGIRTDRVPSSLSRVAVSVNDRVTGTTTGVALHAGLAAVAQDDDGALRPVSGWYLAPAPVEIDDVLDRLVAEAETTAPAADLRYHNGPADLGAVYRRVGSARLRGDALTLRAIKDRAWIEVIRREPEGVARTALLLVGDLADGRALAAVCDDFTEDVLWVTCRVERREDVEPVPGRPRYRLAEPWAGLPVHGRSLALVLQTVLDQGDLSGLETGRLGDVLVGT